MAIAAIAVTGYYGYRQSSLVEVPQPAAASGARRADAAPVKSDETAQPVSPPAAPLETPIADRAPVVETEPRADRESEKSRPANAAAGQIARPRASAAGKARNQQLRQEVCTQSVEALGLCTMTPEERRQAEAVAALKAASARPEATGPGPAGALEAPRPEPCTEAVEALGLCARGSTQRSE
ncbi:MAG: hypothetical protein OEO84_11230 [Betaproteobacteria bacterium]|nr:hypothetical protein [Betaproteobacteria bacterium]